MDVVIGSGAVANALARATGAQLATPEPVSGPFLWRRAALDSGEGVLAALRGADRVWLILPDDRPVHGVLAVLQQLPATPGVCAIAPAATLPPALSTLRPRWSVVSTPATLGRDEPLVSRWTTIIQRGGHLWIADPDALHAADEAATVGALRAAMDVEAGAFSIPTAPFRLPQLAGRIARQLGRPLRTTRAPFGVAMWRVGLSAIEVRARFSAPGPREAPIDASAERGPHA